MNISISKFERFCFALRVMVFALLTPLPSLKQRIRMFVNPLDATRYIEVPFMFKALEKYQIDLKDKTILDVSSPYVPAYLLSEYAYVVKTDINQSEAQFIKPSQRLRFELANALKLSYPDNSFDMTYSISVIEHIYGQYKDALIEMLRVTKPGGHVYVTFPISRKYREDWISEDPYGSQLRLDDRVFFQYIFDEAVTEEIIAVLNKRGRVLQKNFYFEKSEDGYDRFISDGQKRKHLGLVLSPIAHMYYGVYRLCGYEQRFSEGRGIGVGCLLIEKI